LACGVGLALLGCASPRSAFDQRLQHGTFAFVMGQGSAWLGYDVLRVNSAGECWYTFGELDYGSQRAIWREADFRIPDQTLLALKQVLNDTGFFALHDEYRGSGAHSRTQWFFKVRIGETRKAVFLDSEFPLAAVRLEKFVSENVLDPQRSSFKTARQIRREQADEPVRF
jgi:hypothetical protein